MTAPQTYGIANEQHEKSIKLEIQQKDKHYPSARNLYWQ
jgi:hypothetical protein